jgi:hypothetical protein
MGRLRMRAKVSRVFVYRGREYRLVAGTPVGDFPKEVIDKMLAFGLIEAAEKPAGKTGRRKK